LQQAIAGDERASMSHQLYGLYLASVGRSDDAVEHARRAVELAPVSGLHNYSLAQVYLQTSHFEAAIAQAERTLEFDRHFGLAYHTLIRAHTQLGQFDAAWTALDANLRYAPGNNTDALRAYVLARQGRMAEARAVLAAPTKRPRPRTSLAEAAAFVGIGDTDSAFAVLNAGVAAHVPSMLWLRTAPELAPLRPDSRFASLLDTMHWR
jgi:tetratricopeptide (TPR) repeat protein